MILKNFRMHPLLTLIVTFGTLCSASCSPLIFADPLSPYSGYKRQADVYYGLHDRQKLDIYEPLAEEKKEIAIFYNENRDS